MKKVDKMQHLKDMKPQNLHHQPSTFAGVLALENAFKPIREAILVVCEAFENIESDFQRDKIKAFMCSKTLLEAETAIEKQYQLAIAGDKSALQNVYSGMEYWQKVVMKQINYALEVAKR